MIYSNQQGSINLGGIDMHIPEKNFNALTDEQKKRVEAAKTPEELLALAKDAGYELTLDDINKVSGGSFNCPHCQYDACPQKEVKSPSW